MKTAAPLLALPLLLAGINPALADSVPPEQGAFAANLEIAEIPTASTLYGRMFHLNFRLFRGGGVLTKAMASFNNSLMLGLSLRADGVIGSGSVEFDEEPVQALAKIRLLSVPQSRLSLALGYDGMGSEDSLELRMEDRNLNQISPPRGVYAVASKGLRLLAFYLRGHAGASVMHFRHFDSERDINVFFGVDGALSEELSLGMEFDDVLCDGGAFNAAVSYAWDVGLRMELNFLNLFRGTEAHHRALKILYTF